ncbi:unnamed protein product [Dicrocoelium dendriticum]|nr:unnamed protein product [Dicrocoelium dendriticum]
MVEEYISESQWKCLIHKNSYFSYDNFRKAASGMIQRGFLNEGSSDDRVRELAAFLAHCAYSTDNFRHREETNPDGKPYCQFYGRGPLLLTWQSNYAEFSQYYFDDEETLLNDPDIVSRDGEVGFASAIWYWLTKPNGERCAHRGIYRQLCPNRSWGFGRTIMAIGGSTEADTAEGETGEEKGQRVTRRIEYYRNIAEGLKVLIGRYGEQLDTQGMLI